jgi:S-adenosylmethionine:tRNA ribosyltransferase-isomerase
MKTEQLNYDLPAELIAQAPAETRSASRLLVLDRAGGELTDSRFAELGQFLQSGDCLVLNDTKVLPARFFARRQTGAALEGLFLAERAGQPGVWEVMLKGARKVKPGEHLRIRDRHGTDFCTAELAEKSGEGVCLLKVEGQRRAETVLARVGLPPLPPYIRRDGDPDKAEQDQQRYQTVYARRPGAVAAPTAGLHFTEALLEQLRGGGVRFASVTLHVGAGTFKPVTVDELEQHEIHSEWFQLDEANVETINGARAAGGRVIAVGTTATRVLETVGADGHVKPAEANTSLFITPGYRFQMVDAMITNFHLPKSTLLALVAAFASLEQTLAAYHHAIEHRYRFYSYGDAMLIV